MTKFNTLDDAIAIAHLAHRHQKDKAGHAYITHPERVLANVQAQGAQPYTQIAAILHDVTEDTPFTPEMLLAMGVSEAAVSLVRLLDRGISEQRWNEARARGIYKGSTNDYYYERIRSSPEATTIKLADIGDNLQPWRLNYLPDETQKRLRYKYAEAIRQLTE